MLSAHPEGCDREVAEQFAVAAQIPPHPTDGVALVLGASTGYGLASRIVAAAVRGMPTIGVALERPAEGARTASAGWYNTAAFHRRAGAGHVSLNADAFAHDTKQHVVDLLRDRGPVRVLIYSLAAPVRTDPDTGERYRSALKPIGETHNTRTIDLDNERVREVSIEPASDDEIRQTIAVMGGDDLRGWVAALVRADLLAPGAQIVPYSYIGPSMTWPIYRNGTVGRAKEHLEATTAELAAQLAPSGVSACVSVNKAVVTQASSAIPAVPLYISILSRVMKAGGSHERPIDQIVRLFAALGRAGGPTLDDKGRIRLDDLEMEPEVQAEVARLWPTISSQNLHADTDFEGFRRDFHRLFGFARDDVDYDRPVEIDVPLTP
jgi:enoyl-[acyl-carrier protein] reductase/trans-2-enoyl-CoA reductase (NAD+)